jgi:hypothetical protein
MDVATIWATNFIDERLTPPLLHGDEAHQLWLAKELQKWIPDLAQLLNDYYNDARWSER